VQVHIANLASVSTTILARLVMGSLTDYLGPKRAMASVLLAGAVPVFLSG
jgi:nitrate/nitrite transporter NarK